MTCYTIGCHTWATRYDQLTERRDNCKTYDKNNILRGQKVPYKDKKKWLCLSKVDNKYTTFPMGEPFEKYGNYNCTPDPGYGTGRNQLGYCPCQKTLPCQGIYPKNLERKKNCKCKHKLSKVTNPIASNCKKNSND